MAAWRETHGRRARRTTGALALGACLLVGSLVFGSTVAGAEVRVNVAGGGGVAGGRVDTGMGAFAAGVTTPVTSTVDVGGEGFLGAGLDGSMAAVTGAGRYRLPGSEWLRSSLGGGLGWYRVEACDFPLGGCGPSDNAFGFNLGAGVDVPVYRDTVTLGLDARWHHAFVGGGFDAGTALLNLGFRLD